MNQTTEFSLTLFIWKVRWIIKRLLMQQKNFANWVRIMVQEEVDIIKRELEQSLEQTMEMQNSLNNLVQGLEPELELRQNFCWAIMSTAVSKSNKNNILFLKKNYTDVHAWKKAVAQRRLNWEISWRIFVTIVWKTSVLITLCSLLIVLDIYFST